MGEGNFGLVKKCFWRKSPHEIIECAGKTLKDLTKTKSFFEIQNEVNSMVEIRDQNIVSLYGIVMDDGEGIWMVSSHFLDFQNFR